MSGDVRKLVQRRGSTIAHIVRPGTGGGWSLCYQRVSELSARPVSHGQLPVCKRCTKIEAQS